MFVGHSCDTFAQKPLQTRGTPHSRLEYYQESEGLQVLPVPVATAVKVQWLKGAVVAQCMRPQSLNHELHSSIMRALAVVPSDKALCTHCLVL